MEREVQKFIRAAANDGIHGEDEIAINDILTEICPMRKRIARRVKQAFAIAKRDPARLAEFITDAILLFGLAFLVVKLVKTVAFLEEVV